MTYQQRYSIKFRKRIAARSRKWRLENPEKVKEYNRNRDFPSGYCLYGLTLSQYRELANKFKACPICLSKPKNRRLGVDHDHNTGQVRGMLCGNCNAGMGYLKDNPRLLKRAIDYLEGRLFRA